ncbi:topoisomerase II-associated protein PAT1 [Gorgonomyces haynaldii]|nr:topoisomerase II-associated protein PAT1 [Gorgonomyces haynaldii]
MQPQVQPKQQAFSLEQVEAQLRSMRPVDDFGQRSVGMYPQSGYPAPNQLPQMVQQPPQMQQQHLQQQNAHQQQAQSVQQQQQQKKEKYKGLMRKFEKDLIAKIQIANLVTEDPYKDDFYYQLFTVIKESPVPTKKGLKPLLQTQLVKASSVSNHMQQQMKRLIENRKQRPQREQVSLEGALGKISVQSTKNPKKTIQLTEIAVNVFEKQDYKSTLLAIEKVYKIVLVLEQLKRQIPDEQEELVEWFLNKLNTNKQLLFKSLFLMDQIPLTDAHPFVNLLNYNKGMKILSRVFRFMSPDQIFAVYSTIFTRLECLDVINGDKEETEIFLSTVVPQFVTLASDLGFGRVNQLMSILLERHNMVWMCKSSCGLSLLTVLLSRAETLKQEGAKEQEQSAWSEIYNFLFMSLQNQFAQLFVTEKAQDNLYLWQFLSAMAVGASGVEHQGILITEIREHVIKAAKSNDPRSLDNVNLFLKALGLGIDAQQLAQMG